MSKNAATKNVTVIAKPTSNPTNSKKPDYSPVVLMCAAFRAHGAVLDAEDKQMVLDNIKSMVASKRESKQAALDELRKANKARAFAALGLSNAGMLSDALAKAYKPSVQRSGAHAGKLTGTAWLNNNVARYVGKPTKALLDACHAETGRAEVRNHLRNIKSVAKSLGMVFRAPDGGLITLARAK